MGISQRQRTADYRERRYAEIARLPRIACACGCGTLIPPINKQLKPARYAHGHNPDGAATRFSPGQTPWNHGKPFPRAREIHLGKTLTADEIARRTATRRANGNYGAWNKGKPHPTQRQGPQTSGVGAFRPDIGIYVRSRWEANYARYLIHMRRKFVYEPERFLLRLADGRTVSYLPDFLVDGAYYVEIKGWDGRERPTRAIIAAAQAQLPRPLIEIGRAQYMALQAAVASEIPEWEYRGAPHPPQSVRVCANPECGNIITDAPRTQKYCGLTCRPGGMLGRKLSAEAIAKREASRRAKRDGAYF